MNPIVHPTHHQRLAAPPGMDNCDPLTIRHDSICGVPAMVSHWQPSAEELEVLKQGGSVALWICGAMHPPVAVTVEPLE